MSTQTAPRHTVAADQSARLLSQAFEQEAIDPVDWEVSWQEWGEDTFDRPSRIDRERQRRHNHRPAWK
jgi:hypothetical protein